MVVGIRRSHLVYYLRWSSRVEFQKSLMLEASSVSMESWFGLIIVYSEIPCRIKGVLWGGGGGGGRMKEQGRVS